MGNEVGEIRPPFIDIEYGGNLYNTNRIFLLVITIGFFRQFIKDYTELDNFVIDAIDWISSDGLAILFTTTVLPRYYRWFEEKGYLELCVAVLSILLI